MKRKNINRIEILMIIGTILSVCFIVILSVHRENANILENINPLSDGWYYYENGEKVYVELPAHIELSDSKQLLLYYENMTKEKSRTTLTTKGAEYKIQIYLDETNLYTYEDKAFPRNWQMAAKLPCDTVLPMDVEGKTLILVYQNINDGVYEVHPVYWGSSRAVFAFHCKEDAIAILIVFILMILAIVAICVSIYFRRIGLLDKRFLDFAFFLLICGLWCITDSAIGQTVTGLTAATNYISFYSFMLLSIPMLHFVQNTGNMNRYYMIDMCMIAFYMNVIIQTVCNFFFGIPLIDMLFITHIIMMLGIVAVIFSMIREFKAGRQREILDVLVAFLVVALSGVVAVLLYWAFKITYYELIFECGILVYVILLIRNLIQSLVANARAKTELVIYQKMSREDGLTGMKNRRAFQEDLNELEHNMEKYKDAALVFLDVDRLKMINDEFGHHIGDEAIISTAKAIDKIFGKKGNCYRIGGDEFCVIMYDPSDSIRELSDKLDLELARRSNGCEYVLNLSKGVSYLKNEDGTYKSLSDWKYEADQKMYINKTEKTEKTSVYTS